MTIQHESSTAAVNASTLVELLRRRGSEQPGRRAYRFLHDAETGEQESVEYGELDRRARAVGAWLQSVGAGSERALLLYPSGLDCVAAFFGCLYAGTVAVPTYPPRLNRSLQTLRSVAADARPKVVLTTSALLSKKEKIFEQAPELKNLLWLATDDCPRGVEDGWREPPVGSDSLAFLQYSSGSTGTPKGVMISHGNLTHNSSLIAEGFGYTPQTECLTWLPLYHDMGLIGGVLQPLFGGFSSTLMSPLAFARSPYGWLKAVTDYRVTLSGAPDFAYELCVRRVTAEQRATLDLSSWAVAFTGAEPIRPATLERFAEAFAGCGFRREAFMPCYGLAEATLMVSCGSRSAPPVVRRVQRRALEENRVLPAPPTTRDEDAALLAGCGEPLKGQLLRIVNPETRESCGPGEVGEIWVSSPSVARGYWGRPEETEMVFRARVADTGEGPFLRTRDLGYLSDGELFVTGRIDDLIIIRGRNYYPQDVETAVERTHEALRPGGGAVFACELNGENQLVVVHEVDQRRRAIAEALVEGVRRAITEEFELPLQAVVLVSAGGVPKTSSGKVRRRACRTMFLEGGLEAVGEWRAGSGARPLTPAFEAPPPPADAEAVEAWLVSRVPARLGLDPAAVDINQPVTHYGLDSLSAVELAHHIETAFGVSLSMVSLLEGASISRLAAEVWSQITSRGAPVAPPPTPPPPAADDAYPLSHGQRSLWFLQRLEPEGAAYNIAVAARVWTTPDARALRNAFQSLTDRHAALRTTFHHVRGEAVQRVNAHAEVCFEEVEASLWTQASLDERLAAGAYAPFDLEHGPLLRVSLFRRAADGHVLLLAVHHLVADFWSLGIMLHELGRLYEEETRGTRALLAPPAAQYTDYPPAQDEMLRGPEGERHWDYWLEQLSGELPVLNLPTDRPRPPRRAYQGGTHSLRLEDELVDGLKDLSRRREMTLYMTLLAAFQLLLQRYTGQDDLVVGTPTGGRGHARFAGVVGYFVNALPIRADLSADPTAEEFLSRVRERVLGAFAHQEFPFSLLVERLQPPREPGRSTVFDVAFALQKFHLPGGEDISSFALGEAGARVNVGGLELESVALARRVVQFDLTLAVTETGRGAALSFQYDTDLFDAATVARMAGNYKTLLRALAFEPSQPISRLTLLTAAERRQLEEWNATAAEYPRGRCLHELFAEQAGRTPDVVAAVSGHDALTYRELDGRANQLAHHLRGLGVGVETLVGVCAERSLDMLVGVLGILKAGAAYVPLDPAYPDQRLRDMLDDARVHTLLTHRGLGRRLPDYAGRLVSLDADWSDIAAENADAPPSEVLAENLAYVMYTSGSTGGPKAVACRHAGVINLLTDFARRQPVAEAAPASFWTGLSFDVSVYEIFSALLAGGTLHVTPEEVRADSSLFLDWLHARRISSAYVPAFMLREVADDLARGGRCLALRRLLVGVEPIPEVLLRAIAGRSPGLRLINGYGPTEASICATLYDVPADGAEPARNTPIGSPVQNVEVYLFDDEQRPVPVGVRGEIYVGGVGLARGYHNRPAATAERFVPHPSSREAGARLYRTGDMARYLPDGNIEFLGRRDHQVKVRGHRVEPGEIKYVLERHEGVGAAEVLMRETGRGGDGLVAYVVARGGVDGAGAGELRQYLAERLPRYMVPAAFVMLDEMPLTANGKIDRRALPAPDSSHASRQSHYAPPRTALEAELERIWAEALALERAGVDDNFFDLGGHSLMAARLVSRIREVFNVELPLRALFESPTVALLAGRVEEELRAGTEAQAPPIRPVERGAEAPLSYAQQRLWFLDQLEGPSPAYNMPAAVRLDGLLHPRALARAFAELLRRHEALRTSFASLAGRPLQLVAPHSPPPLPLLDLSALRPAARAQELSRLRAEEARLPFDLTRPPLLRLRLLRLSPDRHVALVTMHHIASDGWSVGLLVKELAALYEAYAEGRESPLAELPVQYADYAAWQREHLRGERLTRELAYWRAQLAGAPALELPTDRPRPAAASYRGGHVGFRLTEGVTRGLREAGRREGATLFMVTLAGFQALLSRYTGQREVVVGTPVAGRGRRELEGLIGFFVNTVVLRGDLSGDPSFAELVGRARGVTLEGYAHAEVPFERVVEELAPERDLSRSPLFQVMVSYLTNPLRELRLPGLSVSLLETSTETTKFDVSLELLEDGESLTGTINYSADLFDEETVVRMAEHYQTLLAAAATEPEQRLSRLPLLGADERRRLLVEWNATSTDYPNQECIRRAFERQVGRTPDATALVFQDEAVSYRELNRRANQLAHHLRGMGVGVETLVGICVERSVEMVVGLLGILKAGGAYLPLDPDSPRRRLEAMTADAGVAVVLTQQHRGAALDGQGLRLVHLDGGWAEIARQSDRDPETEAGADNLAYVMYTSGSTGEPKGVCVVQRSVLRLVKETNYAELGPGERVLQLAPITFDASTFEIWGCLLNGGQLVVMSAGPPSLEELGETLTRRRVTTLWLTAGLFHQMVDAQLEELRQVRQLLAGGDVLSPPHVRKFLGAAGAQRLVNGYGPTENTTFTCCHPMTAGGELGATVPIGRPVSNTTVYVLDGEQRPVPVGVVGELCVGGDGLARGYLKRPALTAERFIPNPYAGTPGERLYRTGDRVRYLRTGEIEFVGRFDEQVKLRGFRVEPGEVKHVLEQHAEVREAEVIVRAAGTGDKRLVAYVVREGTRALSDAELRDFAGERLPRYMVPSAFVTLDEMPLTPNGKVDRRALPEPSLTETPEFVAPRTPTEEIVAGIWSRTLGVPRIGLHDDFFQLGGHSLLATQVVSRLREAFKVEVGLRALFANPTVSALAELVEKGLREDAGVEVPPIKPLGREGKLPLSYAQRRLWFLDQLEPGNTALNMSAVVRFRGLLDAALLERALSEITRRHEILRATVCPGEEGPFQLIAPHRLFALPLVDLRGVARGRRAAEERRLTLAETQQPFDLARDRLLRARLLRLDDAEHVLLFTMHHIVSDGWSMRVLLREVQALYEAYAQGRPSPLPELPVQYTDYGAWQQEMLQGEELARQLSYWRAQLAGAPSLLQLPADRPRPSIQTFSGRTHTLLLDAALRDALLDLSRGENATLFMTLLAAFEVLLQRLSGQDDFLVGTPIAGRNRAEVEELIGFFINSLALRTDLHGDPTFRLLLHNVRERTLGAYAHQDVPFEKVLEELQPERTLSHTPLFQVFFNMLNLGTERLELPGVEADFELVPEMAAKFDLTLYVEEREDGISLRLVYNSDLFTDARVAELLAQYGHLLSQVVRDPGATISSFSLVTPTAREVLPDPSRALDDTWVGSVHALFSEHARRSPRRQAVGDRHDAWTYGELDSRSNQLANFMLAAGIRKGDVVVVYSHRGASLVWALLGIMKAGAAFVLLDPTYPAGRIIECLRIAEPRGWLQLEEAGPPPAELDEFVGSMPLCVRLELPTRAAAEARGLLSECPTASPAVEVGPGDLAYLSFTSGTTGRPKAVLGRHGPLTHFLPWLKETFGLDDSAVFTMLSGLSHDPLHRDIFTPLQLGGRISVPDPGMIGTPGWLARWMRRERVTVANLTPAMGRFLLESSAEESEVACLRHLFFVGDVLTRRDVALFRRLAPAATCVNFYGSTETQRAVSYHVVPPEQSVTASVETHSEKEIIPLGRGIRDVQLLLLNAGGGLAGVGEVGEIYFRSPHLAQGYKGDAALTAERFVVNPFGGGAADDRLYRTGDLGRYTPDGVVEPLGRRDAQVKVRGYRVELGEIESTLAQHPSVGEAAVVARQDDTGEKWLVAYFVPQPDAAATGGVDLREYLRQRLPDYMVPAGYVALDKLPLTPNGKLDRAALPAPEQSLGSAGGDGTAPRTPVEKTLAAMWAELLRLPRVGLHDNFFEVGGHSLLGIQLVSRVRQEFRVEIPLRALFETPTIAALSSLVERGQDAARAPELTDAPIERRKTRTVEELLAELE